MTDRIAQQLPQVAKTVHGVSVALARAAMAIEGIGQLSKSVAKKPKAQNPR